MSISDGLDLLFQGMQTISDSSALEVRVDGATTANFCAPRASRWEHVIGVASHLLKDQRLSNCLARPTRLEVPSSDGSEHTQRLCASSASLWKAWLLRLGRMCDLERTLRRYHMMSFDIKKTRDSRAAVAHSNYVRKGSR